MSGIHVVLLFMMSRSRSSMVTRVFVEHGYHWSSTGVCDTPRGRQVPRYDSYENDEIWRFLNERVGPARGKLLEWPDFETLDDFVTLVDRELPSDRPCVWKGAVEYANCWYKAGFGINGFAITRSPLEVFEALKARGKRPEDAYQWVVKRRRLLRDLGVPEIDTDELVMGDYTSLERAFGPDRPFNRDIAKRVILHEA